MVFINNIDGQSFSLNGIPYFKNFLPHVVGDNLRVVNQYDTSLMLSDYKNFSEYSVDGNTFASIAQLQSALLPVLYTRNSLGGGIAGDSNQIVYSAGFSLVGQTLTIQPLWIWKIFSNIYSNPIEAEINIPFSASGKVRIDRIAATINNNFVRIVGPESAGNAVAPALPPNMVEVTFFTVTDGSISQPPLPIIGSDYVKKSYFADNIIDTSANNVSLPNLGKGNFIIKRTGNKIIKGMSTFHLETVDGSWLSVGQSISIDNDSGFSATLKKNIIETYILPFTNLPGDVDFVVADKTRTVFRYTGVSLEFQSYSHVGIETLALAKAYTDTAVSGKENSSNKSNGPLGNSAVLFPTEHSAKSYSDAGDSATLNAAKAYADSFAKPYFHKFTKLSIPWTGSTAITEVLRFTIPAIYLENRKLNVKSKIYGTGAGSRVIYISAVPIGSTSMPSPSNIIHSVSGISTALPAEREFVFFEDKYINNSTSGQYYSDRVSPFSNNAEYSASVFKNGADIVVYGNLVNSADSLTAAYVTLELFNQ